MSNVSTIGTKEEQAIFSEVERHYTTAKEDLLVRIAQFDKYDILFRSHIEESNWPYRSMVFDPRTFTALYEKTARTFANKPRGRMTPREGGDVLKAKINNEILNFQWDDNDRVENMTMLQKWMHMDLNARKYGASFGLAKWHYERKTKKRNGDKGKIDVKSEVFFDGPDFKPLNNRDCLANPSYSTIKHWFQHREYPTLDELMSTNDVARSKPIYKNLDLLRQRIRDESKKGGDTRDTNFISKNKSLKGLTDYLGTDEVFRTIEVVTEYRNDRWITFAPKHGVVIRDIENPYDHGQIPVVLLKYYPIDDDIYGLSEIEPIEKLQKAINAIFCQYLDAINMSLYSPLKVSSVGGAVQVHTLEFGPGKKWFMQNPSSDVVAHDQNITGVNEFTTTYRFLVSALQEALGETSAVASNLAPGSGDKTATEVKDLQLSRNARDNFNQLLLGEAMKKQMMFWYLMNKQFFFGPQEKQKIIQIVGKDAIKYFESMGLNQFGVTDEMAERLTSPEMEGVNVRPEDVQQPLHPVETPEGAIPKFDLDESGELGNLIVEPGDLSGNYDYIPDISSMTASANDQAVKAKSEAIALLTTNAQVVQSLAQEGKRVKISDLIVDYLEDIQFKNADQYIESIPNNMMQGGVNGQPNLSGEGNPQAGGVGMVNGGNPGIPGSVSPLPGSQATGVIPGPV